MKNKIVILMVLMSFLVGCAAVVVAGAAGGAVVYDRRSLTAMEKDTRIFHVIHTDIVKDPKFYDARVIVASYNRVVVLLGQVPASQLRDLAEKIAQRTPNVERVYNYTTVDQKLSIAQQGRDTLITGELRSKLLTQKDLESGSIRIITENRVVYLLGIVTAEQADMAVNIARQIKGVDKVVKVFRYIR
jgi:osmotically-inducible protein OsmY